MVVQGWGGWESIGSEVITNRCMVSFRDDENVLKFIVVIGFTTLNILKPTEL